MARGQSRGTQPAGHLQVRYKIVSLGPISRVADALFISRFLIGDTQGAKDDLQESLDILPSFTQTWVKIASVHMELGEHNKAFEAFTTAISYDEKDPDIYYHRGQGETPTVRTNRTCD